MSTMSNNTSKNPAAVDNEYKYGFVTDIETEQVPKGLNEDIIRIISSKKNEPQWMLDYRLKAYRHWLTMDEPTWAHVHYPKINFQDIVYYSAPNKREFLASPSMWFLIRSLLVLHTKKF